MSAQRLCNFRCTYCVSVDDYAKSNSEDWYGPEDLARFERIVRWMADRPFRMGVRLATLGEPFASRPFLKQAAWLSTRPNVDFVELLTNGSLLKRRLDHLRNEGDISKVSLWITHHHSEMGIGRLIDNARLAQEEYGCFVVVNGLLFPDNEGAVIELREAARAAGLRFNLDLGYDPRTPHGAHSTLEAMVPVLREGEDGVGRAVRLGADPDLLELNLAAMRDLRGRHCSAGHDYFYIGIRGDVFRCSRYQALGRNRLGNVLDTGFELELDDTPSLCEARFGCGNKEDFLNLRRVPRDVDPVPSLGWAGVARQPLMRIEGMTWPEYRALVASRVAVLPVGAIDGHGPHLPLSTDTVIATHLAHELDRPLDILVLPAVPYGRRTDPAAGGGEFPGVTALRASTLTSVVLDVLRASYRHGARRFLILDSHKANVGALSEAVDQFIDGAPDARVMAAACGTWCRRPPATTSPRRREWSARTTITRRRWRPA